MSQRQLRIPRTTGCDWLAGAVPLRRSCDHRFADLPADYVYLLGLYAGDGCISAHPRDVYRLRTVLDVKYPGIIATTAAAMHEIRRGKTLAKLRPDNCVEVSSYWKCWPCLFPQHGPGKKHERRIVLAECQEQLVARWPGQLIRGLINSDGHRFLNTGRCNWVCPRYAFTNHSTDIREIFCAACERLDLHWTASGKYTIYVSRKVDVATFDRFIGPKQ